MAFVIDYEGLLPSLYNIKHALAYNFRLVSILNNNYRLNLPINQASVSNIMHLKLQLLKPSKYIAPNSFTALNYTNIYKVYLIEKQIEIKIQISKTRLGTYTHLYITGGCINVLSIIMIADFRHVVQSLSRLFQKVEIATERQKYDEIATK